VLQLKVTNQTNRGLSALRMLFDPQCCCSIRTSSDLVQVLCQRDRLNWRNLRREELLILQKC
jgi:hypothetical protein